MINLPSGPRDQTLLISDLCGIPYTIIVTKTSRSSKQVTVIRVYAAKQHLLFLSKLNYVCEFVNTFRNETPIESRIPFQAIVSNVHQPLENLLRLRQNYADTLKNWDSQGALSCWRAATTVQKHTFAPRIWNEMCGGVLPTPRNCERVWNILQPASWLVSPHFVSSDDATKRLNSSPAKSFRKRERQHAGQTHLDKLSRANVLDHLSECRPVFEIAAVLRYGGLLRFLQIPFSNFSAQNHRLSSTPNRISTRRYD